MQPIQTLATGFFLLLLVQAPSAWAQSAPTVYAGLVSITPTNAPVLAAVDGGYFQKYGLNIKPLVMSGSSTAIAAMLSGEMSFITIAGSGIITHKRELIPLPVLRYSSGHRKGRLKFLSIHRLWQR